MLIPNLFATLFGAGTALALPIFQHNDFEPSPGEGSAPKTTLPTTVSVTYYQGTPSTSSCGMVPVSTGNITLEECTTLETYSLSVEQMPSNKCGFVLYKGTSSCSGASSTETTQIPAGSGSICIVTDVQDGGQFDKASGMVACSSGA